MIHFTYRQEVGVTRWSIQLWHCTTSRKIAVSIPYKVMAFLLNLFGRTVALGTNRNECQKHLHGGKGGRYIGLITLPPSYLEILEPYGTFPSLDMDSFTQLLLSGLKPTNYLLTTTYVVQYPLGKIILIKLVDFQNEI